VATPNSAGLSEILSLAGRCSDHKKGISPLPCRLAALSGPSAPAAFPSREEGRSSGEDGGGHGPRDCCGILGTTPPRATRFRKTLVVDKRRAFTELPSSFERTEQGVGPMADRWGTATDSYFFRFFSSEQVDQMLRDGAKRGRAGSHAAIERILKREPEVKRAELWRRIRCLKYPSRATRCRRSVILPLSKELTGMLKKLFRKDGPVFDTTNFRREWIKACVKLGLGKMTGEEWHQYGGLIPHDFRRSAVRNLIQAGVDQSTAMRITGHRTVAVFQRYNIVSTEQLHEAMAKVSENATKTQIAVGNSRNNP